MNLLLFPEELLERILEEVVLYPAPPVSSPHTIPPSTNRGQQQHLVSPEAPSQMLGPSPISTPSSTPKTSPSTTRHVSPTGSPTRTTHSSHIFQLPSGSGSSPPSASVPPLASGSRSTSRPPVGAGAAPLNAGPTRTSPQLTAPGNPGGSSGLSSITTPTPTPTSTATSNARGDVSVLAPLLTCRLFSRIALPLYYRVVYLKSRAQARAFLHDALGYVEPQEGTQGAGQAEGRERGSRAEADANEKKRRARWIRRLVIGGIWQEAGLVLQILADLVPQATRPTMAYSGLGLQTDPAIAKCKGKGKARATADDEEAERRELEAAADAGVSISLKVLEITIDGVASAPPFTTSVCPIRAQQLPLSLIISAAPRRPRTTPTPEEDVAAVTGALTAFAQKWSAPSAHENPLRHLVLRKPQNVYLTQPRAKKVISAIASVVESAEGLESAFVAFRISDDPQSAGAPPPAPQVHHHSHLQQSQQQQQQATQVEEERPAGPITQLTSALAGRTKLKTFTTMLPSVWNEAVLRVSRNEALERIVLLGVNGMPVCAPSLSPQPSGPGPSIWAPPPSPAGDAAGATSATSGTRGGGAAPGVASGPGQQGASGSSSGVAGGVGSGSSHNATSSSEASGAGASRRPRLAVVLPPNPVERVYAASARGVDGYHPSTTTNNATPHVNGAPGYGGGAGYVSMGTGLFMNGARKHERLCELIRAGGGVGEGEVHVGERRLRRGRVSGRVGAQGTNSSSTTLPSSSSAWGGVCFFASSKFDNSPVPGECGTA